MLNKTAFLWYISLHKICKKGNSILHPRDLLAAVLKFSSVRFFPAEIFPALRQIGRRSARQIKSSWSLFRDGEDVHDVAYLIA